MMQAHRTFLLKISDVLPFIFPRNLLLPKIALIISMYGERRACHVGSGKSSLRSAVTVNVWCQRLLYPRFNCLLFNVLPVSGPPPLSMYSSCS